LFRSFSQRKNSRSKLTYKASFTGFFLKEQIGRESAELKNVAKRIVGVNHSKAKAHNETENCF
jgi:hypothetical protein